MGVLKKTRDMMSEAIEFSYRKGQWFGEKKKIHDSNRQKLIAGVSWTREQQSVFENYWKKNYGKEISSEWHKLYQSFTGNFCVDYFPEILFSSSLEPMWDKNPYNDVLEDKNLLFLYSCAIGGGV